MNNGAYGIVRAEGKRRCYRHTDVLRVCWTRCIAEKTADEWTKSAKCGVQYIVVRLAYLETSQEK